VPVLFAATIALAEGVLATPNLWRMLRDRRKKSFARAAQQWSLDQAA